MRLLRDVKSAARDIVHKTVIATSLEDAMSVWVRRAPVIVQEILLRRISPPPGRFGRDVRSVERRGLVWQLDLSDYFQWHQFFGFQDDVLDALLILTAQSSCFIDAGANIGFYSVCCAFRAPACDVIAVEANPQTAEKLREHIRVNRMGAGVRVACVGLGADSGVVTLLDDGNGEPGKFSLRSSSTQDEPGGRSVPMTSLDALCFELGATPDLVKIDVEGLEPDVIVGGRDVISQRLPMLVFEWTPAWLHARSAMVARACTILEQSGYRVVSIDGVDEGQILCSEVEIGRLRSLDKTVPRNLLAHVPGCDARAYSLRTNGRRNSGTCAARRQRRSPRD